MSNPEWSGTEHLPDRCTLLEASAGTGKTYQIAHLVTRLVAEEQYSVPIENILIITFTNAAVAELRVRVRKRLVEAKMILEQNEPCEDKLLEELREPPEYKQERSIRIQNALRDFDLAPITTIHGFCQRMLEQLAFESNQETGLELLTDEEQLRNQLIDDEVSQTYAHATAEELDYLEDFGWNRTKIKNIYHEMTKAVAPVVEPSQPNRSQVADVILEWKSLVAAFLDWVEGEEGLSCIDALRLEFKVSSKKRRIDGLRTALFTKNIASLKQWLHSGGLFKSKKLYGKAIPNLQLQALKQNWKEGSCTEFEGYELFARVSELIQHQERLWSSALSMLAHRARQRFEQELHLRGALTYDSMLSRLSERIQEQGAEGSLACAIRERYKVAVVDEFQDTDGAQWPILQHVFDCAERRLLLVGDPKQAIYAFRSADIHVYLHAVQAAKQSSYTMKTNWRSDGPLVQAMNHLWSQGSDSFDLGVIDYVAVGVPKPNNTWKIRNLPPTQGRDRSPLELRWFDSQSMGPGAPEFLTKDVSVAKIAERASIEVANLLRSHAEIEEKPNIWRKLQPNDIAILVKEHNQAKEIQNQLQKMNIPSVRGGQSSVLQSPVVDWMCCWLDAIAQPKREKPARALAVCPLIGWSFEKLHSCSQEDQRVQDSNGEEWIEWRRSIQYWSQMYQKQGFFRVFERTNQAHSIYQRLLSSIEGERLATDLRHLAELLHTQERKNRQGAAGLAAWLRKARESEGKNVDDTRQMRLETDDQAVKLVTIHHSKGLEYPIVLLPFSWADKEFNDKPKPPILYHPSGGSQQDSSIHMSLHLSGTEARKQAKARKIAEDHQEYMRQLYVALTRACHHVVAWLGPMFDQALNPRNYALGRLAIRSRDANGIPDNNPDFPSIKKITSSSKPETRAASEKSNEEALLETQRRLDVLCQSSNHNGQPLIGWSMEVPNPFVLPAKNVAKESVAARIEAEMWSSGKLTSPWQVSSYSSMVKGRTADISEPLRREEQEVTPLDEPTEEEHTLKLEQAEPNVDIASLGDFIPSKNLRGGAEVGTWVHAVLEHLDFQKECGPESQDLLTLCAQQGVVHAVHEAEQHQELQNILPNVLDTPLDGGAANLPKGYSLRHLSSKDRLDELAFDMRVGAGNLWSFEHNNQRINVEGVRLALEHRLSDTKWGGHAWLSEVLQRTQALGKDILPKISGILTGFIDLTFRSQDQRYFVADYKTNRIGSTGRRHESTLGHYTPAWLDWEMAHHGYHLQSLLYTVALHRFLEQRLQKKHEKYEYDRHIGGHLYLFVRGMVGKNTPRKDGTALGVYSDRWPAAVVLGLDAALSGESTDHIRDIIAAASKGASS